MPEPITHQEVLQGLTIDGFVSYLNDMLHTNEGTVFLGEAMIDPMLMRNLIRHATRHLLGEPIVVAKSKGFYDIRQETPDSVNMLGRGMQDSRSIGHIIVTHHTDEVLGRGIPVYENIDISIRDSLQLKDGSTLSPSTIRVSGIYDYGWHLHRDDKGKAGLVNLRIMDTLKLFPNEIFYRGGYPLTANYWEPGQNE
ncbi:MAG: hypothetical protein QS98_C0003G0012 [archaeon GW2011_AR3]|nr:MAG: hypothetical protein QS98_C0003G0012 [archaeon GW2011_AR3]MBS3110056.1 hypothetical protein [Candidatus Woesearchaeota archaeon]